VDDPFNRLMALEVDFLWRFIIALPANAAYLLVFVAGVLGYVRAMREKLLPPAGWAGVALSLYGILSVVGHPVYTQADRLGSSLWVGVAMGVGLLARSVAADVVRRKKAPQDPAASGRRVWPHT
jgi:O-antigen ligase